MARKYDWFYRQCPYGAPLTLLLRHEASGEWVGVASAGPRQMVFGGRRVSAGVLVDLAVLPAHRSLGPALTLQTALMEAGAKRFDLLYGFPNPKAAAVFRRDRKSVVRGKRCSVSVDPGGRRIVQKKNR